jgi:Putative lumazine-binding
MKFAIFVSFRRAMKVGTVLLAAIAMAFPVLATTPDERAVLASVQALFDGMAKRDRTAVREQLLPGGMATLLRNGRPIQLHFDVFVASIPTSGTQQIEERIHDPIVHIDEDIALVWAPYEFLADGKVEHCGTDVINLLKKDGHWLISGIADNTHQPCPQK